MIHRCSCCAWQEFLCGEPEDATRGDCLHCGGDYWWEIDRGDEGIPEITDEFPAHAPRWAFE